MSESGESIARSAIDGAEQRPYPRAVSQRARADGPTRPTPGRAAVVAVTVALVGCDPPESDERARTLVVVRASDAASLDPARATDTESAEVNTLVYDTLVHHQPETGALAPWLARSWEVDGAGTTWTLHLRPGVRFSDGTPLDAAAVAWNLGRLFDPRHPAHRGRFAAIDDDAFSTLRIEVVDATTVRLTLAAPYAPFLASLSRPQLAMVSPAAGDDLAHHPVGSGPYRLDRWLEGDRLVLVRNPEHWGPPASFARLVFEVEPDARQRLIELESGAADLARGVRPGDLGFVTLHPGLVLQRRPGDNVTYLAFHTGRPPFSDPGVRAAIARGVDKEALVRLAYRGLAVPAHSPVPPTEWGHWADPAAPPPDLAAARAALAARAEAGAIELGRTYRLYVPSTPRSYLPDPEVLARALATNLEAIGLRVELVLQPIDRHRTDTGQGLHDLAVFGWSGELDDPDDYVSLLSSAAIGAGWSRNIAFYRSPELDRAIVSARRERRPDARLALYVDIQARLARDLPWVPLAHAQSAIVAREDLTGIFLGMGGVVDYRGVVRVGR